jgi:integrase
MTKLSDTKIKAAITKAIKAGKGRKLYDESGLYLQLKPRGDECGAWWRLKYFWAEKERLLSVGVYPDIGLAVARVRRDEIRRQIAHGVDPSADRKQKKRERVSAAANTFRVVALLWTDTLTKRTNKHTKRPLTAEHIERVRRRFELHVFPTIGSKAIAEITEADMRICLEPLEDRLDTQRRTEEQCDEVFRYARRKLHINLTNPMDALRDDRKESGRHIVIKHHAALTNPKDVGALLRAIDAYNGSVVVRCALRIAPLLFVRPGELRHARWEEFELGGKEPQWRIPGSKMKMGEQHIVPLAPQALAILQELQPLTGADGVGYVFPSTRNASRPMSENTINVALRACGYTKEQQSAHGFRSIASTLLNELGWNSDAIERQLAHGERDNVRGSYNFAEHLPLRRKMMLAWADHLDALRAGGKVVAIGRARK